MAFLALFKSCIIYAFGISITIGQYLTGVTAHGTRYNQNVIRFVRKPLITSQAGVDSVSSVSSSG